jgi:hypothetical protein
MAFHASASDRAGRLRDIPDADASFETVARRCFETWKTLWTTPVHGALWPPRGLVAAPLLEKWA